MDENITLERMARAWVSMASRDIPTHLGAITALARPAVWLGMVASRSSPPAWRSTRTGAWEWNAVEEASSALDTSLRDITTQAPDETRSESSPPALPERPNSVRCVLPLRTSWEAISWPRPPRISGDHSSAIGRECIWGRAEFQGVAKVRGSVAASHDRRQRIGQGRGIHGCLGEHR